MTHKLPKLPYSYSALEPYIDSKTMKIHHTKHHQTYVDNLNKTLEGNQKLQKYSIEELLKNINKVPQGIKQAVINNGGGHLNHSFYWNIMTPYSKSSKPSSFLLNPLKKTFGGMENFENLFSQKSLSLFGSGWVFLIVNKKGALELKRHSFQNTPIIKGNTPILGIDLWEHAYYLKYQNRRVEYIKAFWNVINWQKVEENYKKA